GAQGEISILAKDAVDLRDAAGGAEPGEQRRLEVHVALGRGRVARGRSGELARRRARRMAPDGVRLAAPQRPLGEHHAALHDLDASQRRPVHEGRLGRGRYTGVVEAGDSDLLPEPAPGPEVTSWRE